MDSGHVLKIELTEFAEGLDVGFVRRREGGIKDKFKVFDLCNWKD